MSKLDYDLEKLRKEGAIGKYHVSQMIFNWINKNVVFHNLKNYESGEAAAEEILGIIRKDRTIAYMLDDLLKKDEQLSLVKKHIHFYSQNDANKYHYLKEIRFPSGNSGKYRYVPGKIPSGFTFAYTGTYSFRKVTFPDLYIATEPIDVFAICDDAGPWMSASYNELLSMQECIDNAHGDVLIFGLGLGCCVYECLLKEDVNSITVVELSQDVIDMFRNHLAEQFPHPEKLNIVKADAFEYMKDVADGKYDYIYMDIWRTPLDGLGPYLKMLQYEKKMTNTRFGYWAEEGILDLVGDTIFLNIQLRLFPDMPQARMNAMIHPALFTLGKRLFEKDKPNSVEELKRIVETDKIRQVLLESDLEPDLIMAIDVESSADNEQYPEYRQTS